MRLLADYSLPMDTEYLLVQGLMTQLKTELIRLELWSGALPADEQINSNVPFCHDTLNLHEWLEWVFLPNLETMLEVQASLPDKCDIANYAELVFPQQIAEHDIGELVSIIRLLDEAITSQPKAIYQ